MKREQFKITYGDNTVLKNSWNASIREIEKIALAVARSENTKYRLIDSESHKSADGFGHVKGFRVWRGDNGKTIRFNVEKLETNPAQKITIQVKRGRDWKSIRTAQFKTKKSLQKYLSATARISGLPVRAIRADGAHSQMGEIKQAASRLKRFSGHDALKVVRLTNYKQPSTVLAVGPLIGMIYEAKRDGKVQSYIHKFAKHARPLFAASHDGRQLYMLGGAYTFTDRGIVDKS